MTSPTYCAPCIADLALVREAATTVAGTASCLAHAVLLSHATDDPGRRRQRLDALKDLATSKAETAEPAEQVKLELLVQEYGLAGAMDMGQPARRGPQQPHQPHQPPRQGAPSAPGEGRKSRRGRARGDRPEGQGGPGAGQGQPRGERRPGALVEGAPVPSDGAGETPSVTPASGPAADGAPDATAVPATSPAPTSDTPSAPAEAPAAPSAPAEAPAAPSAPAEAPAPAAAPDSPAVVPSGSAPDA